MTLKEEPLWITEDLALTIHNRQLAEHGGLSGVQDAGLLSSALARPMHLMAFSADQVDITRLAASYAFDIAKNHPFIDGNKRTSHVVYRTFLSLNHVELSATQVEKYSALLRLAEGNISEAEFAEWIRKNSLQC